MRMPQNIKFLYILIIHKLHKWKVNSIREKTITISFCLFKFVFKPIDKLCWENKWQVVVSPYINF